MVHKLINATDAKPGNYIIVEGAPCVVKKVDISKTGKHGASKVRIEAIGLIDEKKRIIVKPGHERLECPLIEKRKAQVLSLSDNHATIMDVETFETLENIPLMEGTEIGEGDTVEYWIIEGAKIIKRKV